MNFKIIGRILGQVMLLEALFLSPSLILCAIDREPDVAIAILLSIALTAACGGVLFFLCKNAGRGFFAQEGFVTTALCWILLSAFGALPFLISGQIPNFFDAFFETVSGFTTTGASILNDVEGMSRGLLYWRSFTHWLGGMGILVFAMAVVPADKNSGGSLHLMRAESPGPSVGKLTPRLRQTAKILYLIYIAMTVLCFLFLLLGGMSVFESLCTAFGTAGTGGFGVKNDSLVSYSPYLQNVCTIFMLLFGVNFSLYYLALLGEVRAVFRDEELRCYLGLFAVSTALITVNILPISNGWRDALHHAAFQVSTIMTTTGFSTVDFNLWPALSKSILLCLMILGASAGSTGGGIKTIRWLLMVKGARRSIRQLLRPRNVQVIHVNGKVIDEEVLRGTHAYISAYWMLILFSMVLISLDNFSIETNVSAVLACFNNIGPGFDVVGPMSNYSDFSSFSKLVLSIDMLLGRLEIFPMLALFSRFSWTRKL
ncbi:MAG: TrkH family potassium uptake protein [Butyricicoccus sp.]|nr:TrkH family potassium uptake protein [Clostridiales bacterium]MDY5971870.1 TrkH family potassium uptake protein [Butyricicoccus sp.]